MFLHFLRREPVAEEEHKFGDGAFRCAVETTDDASLQQLEACLVAVHLHAPDITLRDVYNNDAVRNSLLNHVQEPVAARSIATAESLHHHTFEVGDIEYTFHHMRGYTGEEL